MQVTYNIEKLRKIIDDICTLTGVAMAITDTNRNFLYANLTMSHEFCSLVQTCPRCREKCRECDATVLREAEERRAPFSHICHAGLFDAGMPILKGDLTVGYIIFGRVRDKATLDESILTTLTDCGLDREALLEKFSSTNTVTDKTKKSLLRLLSHVFLEQAIEVEYDQFIQRATDFIDRNLGDPLSVELLCEKLFVSKNYLYRSFDAFYGKTVNKYITDRRIQTAKALLQNTSKSAFEIAAEVGLANYTYFTKLFKKHTGYTPREYRRSL